MYLIDEFCSSRMLEKAFKDLQLLIDVFVNFVCGLEAQKIFKDMVKLKLVDFCHLSIIFGLNFSFFIG